MKWLYTHLLQDPLEQCSAAHWPTLLHAVTFLHVTLTERSALGPPAWNVPSDFTLSDLSSTVRCLQNYVDGLERSKVSHSVSFDFIGLLISQNWVHLVKRLKFPDI